MTLSNPLIWIHTFALFRNWKICPIVKTFIYLRFWNRAIIDELCISLICPKSVTSPKISLEKPHFKLSIYIWFSELKIILHKNILWQLLAIMESVVGLSTKKIGNFQTQTVGVKSEWKLVGLCGYFHFVAKLLTIVCSLVR